jgi:hypothetical protein
MKTGLDRIFGLFGSDERGLSASARKLARAAHLSQLQGHRRTLLESPRYADETRLLKFGYRVYSQSDEDGILHEIFRRIGTVSQSFVEIGCGDGLENNSFFLLLQGWRGVWIEASARKIAVAQKAAEIFVRNGCLRVKEHFVTKDNVDRTVKGLVTGSEIDLLSVDIDGNDYYVLQAIRSISPRVIVSEYNAKFPSDIKWVMEYSEAHQWDGTDYFGASLKSLEMLLAAKGYTLVGCNLLGCNAFFVRNDLVSENLFRSPFTAENHYEPARYFLLPAYDSGFAPGAGPFRTTVQSEDIGNSVPKMSSVE